MKVFDQPPVPANLYQPNADELAALQFDFGVRPSGDPELAQEGGQRPQERRGSPPRRDGDFRQRDDRRPQRDDRSQDRGPNRGGPQQQGGKPAQQASAPEAQSAPPSELAPQENSEVVPDGAVPQTPPAATTEPQSATEGDQFGSGLE